MVSIEWVVQGWEGRRTRDLDVLPDVPDPFSVRKHDNDFSRFILRQNFYGGELGVVSGDRVENMCDLISRYALDLLDHTRIFVLQRYGYTCVSNQSLNVNNRVRIRTSKTAFAPRSLKNS